MLDLDSLTQTAASLDPLPATASQLAAVFAGDQWNPTEVTKLIAADPPLTGKLLRLANSAHFGGQVPIGTVGEAVIRLGADTILSLGIASAVRGTLGGDLSAYSLAEGQAWQHAVAASTFVTKLRPISRIRVPSEAGTTALLHNIGKAVMARHLEASDWNWLSTAWQCNGSLVRAEMELYGVNHAEIGAAIARRWNFPERMTLGVQYYDDPDAIPSKCEEARLIAHAVRIAVHSVTIAESGESADDVNDLDCSLDLFGMTLRDAQSLGREAMAQLDDATARLGT